MNDDVVLVLCGIGKEEAYNATSFMLKHIDIKRTFNIGICGCKDINTPIGTLFSIEKVIEQTPSIDNKIFIHIFETISSSSATITTVDEPLDDKRLLKTKLVDMELSGFVRACVDSDISKYNIHSFKVVSDHLSTKIPKAKFVSELIRQNIRYIVENYLR
jgi:nucleoside phosphorylase